MVDTPVVSKNAQLLKIDGFSFLFAISHLRNATSCSQNCDFVFLSKVEKQIVMSTFTPPRNVVET